MTCFFTQYLSLWTSKTDITKDIEKSETAFDHLQAERQAQHDRLQLAAYRKQELDRNVRKSQLLK